MPNLLRLRTRSRRLSGWFVALGSLVGFSALGLSAQAALDLPSVFGNNMVIARDHPAAIWGWADPGTEVDVLFTPESGSPLKAKAKAEGEKGRWQVELPAQKGGVKGVLEIKTSKGESRKITNVAVGEVWFCSGQSNMFLQLYATENGPEEIGNSADPDIRLLTTEGASPLPLDHAPGRWEACEPRTAKGFSAVGYYFGKSLRKELGFPVGLIKSACNGTPIEAWMPMELLERLPETHDAAVAEKEKIAGMGPLTEADLKRPSGKEEARAWAKRREKEPGNRHSPAGLFNAMVHPFIPYPISGFLWYQGENNTRSNPGQYAVTFPAMIQEWRKLWGRGDLPFLYVELAGYKEVQSAPVEEGGWATLRQAQKAALKLPMTGVATAIDIGSVEKIHPTNKKTVGERLALAALEIAYGRKGENQSPVLASAEFKGKEVVLHFTHSKNGLKTKDGEAPRTFAVRGSANGQWSNAEARIQGDQIILTSSEVPTPKEARYAWASNPVGMNVVNTAGLPLLPFRAEASSASSASDAGAPTR